MIQTINRIISIIVVLFAMTPSLSTAAAPNNMYLTWKLNLGVQNKNLYADWYLIKVMERNGQIESTSIVEKIDIVDQCDKIGSGITITRDEMVLDGSSYLQCTLPDFVARVSQYVANAKCSCGFNTTTPPWIAARVKPSNLESYRPLYASPSLEFGVLKTSTGNGQSVFHIPGLAQTHVSNEFPWQRGGNDLFSGYYSRSVIKLLDLQGSDQLLDQQDFLTAANNSTSGTFLSWAKGATPVYTNQRVEGIEMQPGRPVITIGFNPAQPGAYFRGSISQIIVDPGCRGAH